MCSNRQRAACNSTRKQSAGIGCTACAAAHGPQPAAPKHMYIYPRQRELHGRPPSADICTRYISSQCVAFKGSKPRARQQRSTTTERQASVRIRSLCRRETKAQWSGSCQARTGDARGGTLSHLRAWLSGSERGAEAVRRLREQRTHGETAMRRDCDAERAPVGHEIARATCMQTSFCGFPTDGSLLSSPCHIRHASIRAILSAPQCF